MSSRWVWVVASQGLASGRNLILIVIVARVVSQSEFGAFALATTTGLVAMGILRAVCAEPILVRHSAGSSAATLEQGRAAVGATLLLGAVLSTACFVASLFAGESVEFYLLGLCAVIPALAAQETWRLLMITASFPRQAAINDFIFFGVQTLLVHFLLLYYSQSGPVAILGWAAAAWLGLLVGLGQSRSLPKPVDGVRWLRENRALSSTYLGEFLAVRGAGQATVYLVGLGGGLAAAGALRSGQVLYGALTVAFVAVRNFGQVEAVRRFAGREKSRKLMYFSAKLAFICMMLALTMGAALTMLPASWGVELLGETWTSASSALVPLAIWKASSGVATGAIIGFRSLAALSRGLQARVIGGVLLIICGSIGALLGTANGAALGLAVGGVASAALHWSLLLLARTELGARIKEGEILALRESEGTN